MRGRACWLSRQAAGDTGADQCRRSQLPPACSDGFPGATLVASCDSLLSADATHAATPVATWMPGVSVTDRPAGRARAGNCVSRAEQRPARAPFSRRLPKSKQHGPSPRMVWPLRMRISQSHDDLSAERRPGRPFAPMIAGPPICGRRRTAPPAARTFAAPAALPATSGAVGRKDGIGLGRGR